MKVRYQRCASAVRAECLKRPPYKVATTGHLTELLSICKCPAQVWSCSRSIWLVHGCTLAFVHCGQQHVSSPRSCDKCCPYPCASPPNPECSQIFSHKCWPRQKPKPSLWRPGCDPDIYSKQMALLTKPDKLRWQSTICFVWTMCHLYIHELMFFTNDCFNCRIKHEGPRIELPQHKNILLLSLVWQYFAVSIVGPYVTEPLPTTTQSVLATN